MNIFITGGAGYIGSATAEALIKAGNHVTVYDSLVTGHKAAVPKEAEFIHHIADLVSAHLLALDALDQKDKLIYNVGSGNGFSVREVIETARKVTSHAIPVIESPRRAGDSARLVASPKKIMNELGWKPQNTNLQDILSSAWEWHKSHPTGYEKS